MRPAVLLLPALLSLAGCANTLTRPVLITMKNGQVLRGSTTVTLSPVSGTFSATDGKLTCQGDYDPMLSSPELNLDIQCSDGKKGTAVVHRGTGAASVNGAGEVRMEDGRIGSFLYGTGAGVGAN